MNEASSRRSALLRALLAGASMAFGLSGCATQETSTVAKATVPSQLDIPVEYYKLQNGLKVVLSENHSVPIATLGVYYNIGFRIEPRDRTGFAHLFEHMMFQGSANMAKNEFFKLVQGVGGVMNGSTRFDYTNYYEAFPSNAVETMLWAEADRMRSLDISEVNLTNQKGVVGNEVKVNVLNRPYGGFPWLDVPQYANRNWHNAHNFYGDLEHIEAATLQDVRSFFDTYYAPGNAVLVLAGDFDRTQAKAWIEKYFASIASRPLPQRPDISEPPQTEERRATRTDALAPRPALAVAYHVPSRWTPEYFAFGLLDEILLQGEDSRLYRDLVQQRGYAGGVSGGINILGNMFNYDGPMLWTAGLIHDPTVSEEQIVQAFEDNLARVRNEPVSQEELDRARVQLRSSLYDMVGSSNRFGLVDLLASFALFDDDPARINRLEQRFAEITPEIIMQTAQRYLRPERRTVMTIEPGAAANDTPAKSAKP